MNLTLSPLLLKWARLRAGLDEAVLGKKLGVSEDKVIKWEEDGAITVKRAEKLAKATYTPYGFLFLQEPPEDKLPVPDFRTLDNEPVRSPSPNLLDTVYQMQRRQAWYREYLIEEGFEEKEFLAKFSLSSSIEDVANHMRDTLRLSNGWAHEISTWTDALMLLRERTEELGILIVMNGVVGNNTHRKLDTQEFRGFALYDTFAPLIFINAADYKGAQMFTIAHELAHLWIGEEGVSNFRRLESPGVEIERFCNQVAAEFLVPKAEVQSLWAIADKQEDPIQYLSRRFKVSGIVVARRALDLNLIRRSEFNSFYEDYKDKEDTRRARHSTGGDFWNTHNVRVGRRFGQSVVSAAKEGKLMYKDAYSLLGLKAEASTVT